MSRSAFPPQLCRSEPRAFIPFRSGWPAVGTVLGTARSAVAWNVTTAAPVPVAIAVPLTVPAGESEFLTASQLAEYTAPGGMLTREIADVQNSQIALGIDPRIIASIRILGDSAPQTARDWLKELQDLPNETFPLAWADADLTAPLHAGQTSVLETKTLDVRDQPEPVSGNRRPRPRRQRHRTPGLSNRSFRPPRHSSDGTTPCRFFRGRRRTASRPADLANLNQAGITSLILPSTNLDLDSGSGLSGAAAKDRRHPDSRLRRRAFGLPSNGHPVADSSHFDRGDDRARRPRSR